MPFQLNIDSDAHGEQVESMHENRDSDIILGKNESKAGNAPNEKKAKASIFDLLPDSSDGGPVILE